MVFKMIYYIICIWECHDISCFN